MNNFNAYAAMSAKGPLRASSFDPGELEPEEVESLISGQKSVAGSPSGSPTAIDDMLDFSARHSIAPITETFPMSKVNDAIEHLRAGKARYRIVLENDLA